MPNEFVVKNGLISQGNITTTGSLAVSQNIRCDGNVGIGTSSPTGKLEVRTNAASTYVFSGTSTSGYTTTFTMDDTASSFGHDSAVRSLTLRTNSTARLTITGDGNVGIGTTNPTQKLEVQGNVQIGNDSVTDVGFRLSRLFSAIRTSEHTFHSSNNNPWYTHGQNLTWTGELAGTVESTQPYRPYFEGYSPIGGYKTFGFMNVTASSFTSANIINALVIKNDGNVGIGTTSMVAKLDVYDNTDGALLSFVRNANSGSNAYTAFVLRRDGSNNGIVLFTNSSTRTADGGAGNSTIRTDNGNLLLGAGGTQHVMTTGGLVGIGTTNPANRLSVIGAASIGSATYNTAAPTNGLIVEGNVGIGITNPGAKLVINGFGTNNILRFKDGAYEADVGYVDFTGALSLQNWGGIRFLTGDPTRTERVTILHGGNVGIGTTSPDFLLDVSGSSRHGYRSADTHQFTGSVSINGALNATQIAEKIITFTPLTGSLTNGTSWYRIISGSGLGDYARVRMNTTMDNSISEIEFVYGVRNYDNLTGSGAFVYINRASTYNNVFNAVRVIESGPALESYAVDVLIGNYLNNTTPTAITCLYEGQRLGSLLNAPLTTSVSNTGSYVSKTVYAYNGAGANYIGPVYSDGAAFAQSQGQVSIGYRGNYYYTTPSALNYSLLVSGSVGIGTSNPTYKLDVIGGNISTDGELYSLGGRLSLYRSTGASYIDWSSGQSLIFRTETSVGGAGASEKMRIDNSGNVGIGTSNPVAKLDVAGTINISSGSNNARRLAFDASGVYYNWIESSGSVGAGYMVFAAGNAEVMRVVTGGNVGIGTTNPNDKLHVVGNISASSDVYAGGNVIAQTTLRSLYSAGDEGGEIFLNKATTNTSLTGGIIIDVYQNRLRFFEQGGTNRGAYIDLTACSSSVNSNLLLGGSSGLSGGGIINYIPLWTSTSALGTSSIYQSGSSGNIGIGTTSPNSKLEVAGSAGTAIVSINNTTANRSGSFGIDSSGVYIQNSNNGDYFDLKNASGTSRFRVVYDNNTFLNTSFVSIGSLSNSGSKLSVFGNLSVGSSYGSSAAATNGIIVEGLVGIGTTNPNSALHVHSAFFEPTIRITSTSGSAKSYGLVVSPFWATGSFHIYDFTGDASRIHISNTGTVGINVGSTTPANNLSIFGAVNIGSAGYNTAAPANGLIVEGNVGVGTNNPSYKLHVSHSSGYGIVTTNGVVSSGIYNGTPIGSITGAFYGTVTNHDAVFGSYGIAGGYLIAKNTGNVGIGITTPVGKLDVMGPNATAVLRTSTALSTSYAGLRVYNDQDSAVRALEIDYAGSAYTGPLVTSGPTGESACVVTTGNYPLAIGTNNTARIVIVGGGNVGIGTSNPTDVLDFGNVASGKSIIFNYSSYGETKNSLASIIGNNVKASPTTNSQVRRFASTNDSGSFIKIIYNKGITFHTNITSALNTDISEDTNERMCIDLNGNVGIGTTNPNAKLQISSNVAIANFDWTSLFSAPTIGLLVTNNTGDAKIRIATLNSNSTHDPYLNFLTSGGQNWSIGIDNSDSDKLKISMADGFVAGGVGSNEFLIIDTNGNVGIGTTNPANRLSVIGAASIGSATYNTAAPTNGLIVEGSVGVGTSSPVNKLDVAGNISCSAITTSLANISGITYNESLQIDQFDYFQLQPYVEAGQFPNNVLTSIAGTVPAFTTYTGSGAPFGRVLYNTTKYEAIGDFIPVQAGETLYGEIWALRETSAVGTAGGFYCGIAQYDKDKKVTATNLALSYFVADSATVPTSSTWIRYNGTITLATSHTPFNGSDGGPIRYVRPYIIVNYTSGTIPTFWGGLKIRKQQLTRDAGNITISGSVGIGITNPVAKLDVSGSSNIVLLNLNRNVASATNPVLYAIENNGSPGKTNIALFERLNNLSAANISASSAGIRIREHSSNYALSVEDHSDNSYFVIKGGGNVGIGTTNPINKLDVAGNISCSVITASNFFGTGSWSTNALTASSLVTTNNYQITNLTASNISASGTIRATTLIETSTINAKYNITPLENQLEKINQLNPVSFIYKYNDEPSIGLIAEEVGEIYPEFTSPNKDAVAYGKMVSVLIKSIKELKSIVDSQQEQINKLLNNK